MDFVPGKTLKEAGTLSRSEVAILLAQLSSALVYLHGRSPPLVHRDIKPANILIQSRNPLWVKLGDFGLAKDSEDLMTRCGSDPYLAPEIVLRPRLGPFSPKYTQAVDIWSLGVVGLQYAGQGRLPECYHGDLTYFGQVVDHVENQPNDALMRIIKNMVVSNPSMRLSASRCCEELAEVLNISEHQLPLPMPNA